MARVSLSTRLRRFFVDARGVTSIEYAVLAMLIALAIIIGATTLGTTLNSALVAAANAFPSS